MKNFIFSLVCLFAFSCATTIKNFDSYNKSPLLQSEFMPNSHALEKKLPTVVIFDFQTESANAKRIGATSIVSDYLTSVLISGKLAEVQDRKNLSALEDEIKLAEISGNSKGSTVKAVDFAIEGSIANVTFSSEFVRASYDSNGKMIEPDSFYYTATAQGFIKIYELPSLRVIETIPFSGIAKNSEDAKSASSLQIGRFKASGKVEGKNFDDTLAKEAVRNAISKTTNKFKSNFAKTGYIMEKRVLGENTIFLVNLGFSDGIKQNDKLQISQKYSELNPLTGTEEISIRNIGYGIVADKTEDKKTWIVVKDKNTASKIRLGDAVKVLY